MASQAGFTRAELIDQAAEAGYQITERTFNDWVTKGLLAPATRRGAGRGSNLATWSENQARLLRALLRLQLQTKQLHILANLPVWLWLRHGNNSVGTKQTHRAMRTWADTNVHGPRAQVKHTARKLVSDLNTTSRPSQTLVDGLSEILLVKGGPSAATVDRLVEETIRPELNKLFLTAGTDLLVPSVENYLILLRWRVEGAQTFVTGQSSFAAIESEMEQARLAYRANRLGYLDTLGRKLDKLELDEEVVNACLQFAMQIAVQRQRQST